VINNRAASSAYATKNIEKPPPQDVQDDNQDVQQPLEAVDNLAAPAARTASSENINAKNHDPEEAK
jgi:hypothetical protein